MSKYRKAVVAVVGFVVALVAGHYNSNQTVQAVIGLLTALGVYQVPNA